MLQSLKELQMLAEAEFSIEDTRQDLNAIVEFFRNQEYHEHAANIAFVQERELPKFLVDECKLFFVDEDYSVADLPDSFKAESLGFVKKNFILFNGRLVFPVMDVKGDAMGFCGWDKFEQPKYLDSRNHGYKAKATTFYGMEKLSEYYRSDKPLYVVEGIICCLYLRSIGLQAIALLGSSITPYVMQILKRFGKRLVVIPDNDIIGKTPEEINEIPAGEHLVKQIKRNIPTARVIQSTVAKDVDDTRKIVDHKYEEQFKKELEMVANNPFHFFSTIRVR